MTGLIIEAHLAAGDRGAPIPATGAMALGGPRWPGSGRDRSFLVQWVNLTTGEDPVVAHDNAGLPGYERMSAYAREASRRIR